MPSPKLAFPIRKGDYGRGGVSGCLRGYESVMCSPDTTSQVGCASRSAACVCVCPCVHSPPPIRLACDGLAIPACWLPCAAERCGPTVRACFASRAAKRLALRRARQRRDITATRHQPNMQQHGLCQQHGARRQHTIMMYSIYNSYPFMSRAIFWFCQSAIYSSIRQNFVVACCTSTFKLMV